MKISEKKEDFKIYIEDEDKNYLSSGYIKEAEFGIDKYIGFEICLNRNNAAKFYLNISRKELSVLCKLLNEANKYLNE